jgi:hypothetical protein
MCNYACNNIRRFFKEQGMAHYDDFDLSLVQISKEKIIMKIVQITMYVS